MTPYEYVLRSWELEIVPDLERKYGWSLSTAWRVRQVLKAKQPLPHIYATDRQILTENTDVQQVSTRLVTGYLGMLKELEGLK